MPKLTTRLLLCLCLCLAQKSLLAETATIAVASNFKTTMADLISLFEANYPHQLKQSNASSGVIFNLATKGAPYQAFLAADSRYPQELENNGTGLAGTRFTYAEGQLVMAMTNIQPSKLVKDESSFIAIIQRTIDNHNKIAIANPSNAPYGIAAQQSLQQLKLWQGAKGQLIRGSNVGQAFQYLASGNAAIGFVARAQALNFPAALSGAPINYWPVPTSWYEPIRQQAILLQSGRNNKAAIEFLVFLKSDQAKAIIRSNGYTAP
jgi:molybdate transport system substrate-binding protein